MTTTTTRRPYTLADAVVARHLADGLEALQEDRAAAAALRKEQLRQHHASLRMATECRRQAAKWQEPSLLVSAALYEEEAARFLQQATP